MVSENAKYGGVWTSVLFSEFLQGNCIIYYVLLSILLNLAIEALSENDIT